MKTQILLLNALMTFLLLSCGSAKNDLETLNLKEKVWKVKEYVYYGKEEFGEYKTGSKAYGHKLFEFNEDGNISVFQSLENDGDVYYQEDYIYGNEGVYSQIRHLEDGDLTGKTVTSIEEGKIIREEYFDEDGELYSETKYTYDGDNIDTRFYKRKGTKTWSILEYEYSSGKITRQVLKDSNDLALRIYSFERNKYGDPIKESTEIPKDTGEATVYFDTYEYEYDEKGNWIKKLHFRENGDIDKIHLRNIVYFEESEKEKTDNDFVGMWYVIDDNDWIELRSDKKFDSGYNDRIKVTGNWEIDSKQKILTFRADDPDDSRKYKYEFEGLELILFTINGKEDMRLEKR